MMWFLMVGVTFSFVENRIVITNIFLGLMSDETINQAGIALPK